jgi:hypothetical protein
MRKPTDGQLAIGALIAFAFWIFVALPLYYGQRDDAATHKCSAKEEKDYSFWEKARCDPVAYFTLWLVGFTGVLAVSTIGLWWVTWRGSVRQSRDMQATLDHSRESLLAIERAFVAFSHIDITTISLSTISLLITGSDCISPTRAEPQPAIMPRKLIWRFSIPFLMNFVLLTDCTMSRRKV